MWPLSAAVRRPVKPCATLTGFCPHGPLVQFTYTSLFGAYSSYLFLRTGLIFGPVLAHSFCNCMGLPDFGRALQERDLGVAFVIGLACFTTLVTLDAIYRPPLFGSMLWTETAWPR